MCHPVETSQLYLNEVRELVEVVEGGGGGGVDPQRLQLRKVAVRVLRTWAVVTLLVDGGDCGGSGLEGPGVVQGLGPK